MQNGDARLSLPAGDGGSEPLELFWSDLPTPEAFGDARCRRFEFSSRGDRVPGRLLLPKGAGPHPLLLFEHGAGGSKESPYLDAAARWVEGGLAVATIDLPLHGERSSAKLSERLLADVRSGIAHPEADALPEASRTLWTEFARQSIADLKNALDALATLPELDSTRTAYAAFSLGSLVGTLYCALDERPRAAALALCGGGFGPEAVDPARYVGAIAPRPLLLVNASNDELISKPAAEALQSAAGEGASQHWFEAGHDALPGDAMKLMWSFLKEQLGL
jgi:dienelactone hydrolase